MKVRIDKELCTACELCVDTCPEVFKMKDDIAVVILEKIPPELLDAVREAAEECPAEATIIEEQTASHERSNNHDTKTDK